MSHRVFNAVTISEAMLDGYTQATGKTTLPTAGTSKYNKLYNLAKILHRNWQNEPGVDWNSLWTLVNVGTVTATDTFSVSTQIWAPSKRPKDTIFIRTTSNQDIPYKLVDASQLYDYRYQRAVAYTKQQLVFSRAFTASDQEFGGTIHLPAYRKLDEISSVSDTVQVDNPDWLGAALAAKYVMTDTQRNYLYSDLLEQANELMQKMKDDNERDDSISTGDTFFSDTSMTGGGYVDYEA